MDLFIVINGKKLENLNLYLFSFTSKLQYTSKWEHFTSISLLVLPVKYGLNPFPRTFYLLAFNLYIVVPSAASLSLKFSFLSIFIFFNDLTMSH